MVRPCLAASLRVALLGAAWLWISLIGVALIMGPHWGSLVGDGLIWDGLVGDGLVGVARLDFSNPHKSTFSTNK